jgi:hypothetical protein
MAFILVHEIDESKQMPGKGDPQYVNSGAIICFSPRGDYTKITTTSGEMIVKELVQEVRGMLERAGIQVVLTPDG